MIQRSPANHFSQNEDPNRAILSEAALQRRAKLRREQEAEAKKLAAAAAAGGAGKH